MTRLSRGEDLHRFLEHRVSEGSLPGGAFSVSGPDGLLVEGGVGRLEAGCDRPTPGPDTVYDLASLTKPLVTGLLLALLEEEGRLDLEAPAEAILPELHGSRAGEASLSELARHRSGLPAWRPLYLAGQNPGSYLRQIASEPPAVPRGETLYSDLGYLVLGLVLERVAGRRLSELFGDRVAGPLELRRTGFPTAGRRFADAAPTEQGNDFERRLARCPPGDTRFRSRVAPGEVHDGNAHGLAGEAGHAGLFGSAREVGRLARELVRSRGAVFSPRVRDRLLAVDPGGRSIGFVGALHSAAARGILPDRAPGHTGFTGTSIWIDSAAGRVYVLLTNRVHPQVQDRGFQRVRRGFHRLAAGAAA